MRRHLLPLICIGVFSLWSLKALLQPGQMATHDGLWHAQRATAMYHSLKSGQFPVRWVHELDNSYGIPLFNFIYPAPYYLASGFMTLGLSNILALKAITVIFYFLGGLGMYALFFKHRVVGTTIALLYLLNPYQLVNIFVRGALGETIVMGLIPWIFLFSRRFAWYASLPLALALISHNFLGLLVMAMLLLYGLVVGHLKQILLISLSALGLASFFVLPMVWERGLLYSSQENNYSFIWSDHFIYPQQLLYSRWDYWFSMPGTQLDGMTFQLGFASIVGLILYAAWVFSQRKKLNSLSRQVFYWPVVIILLTLAMIPSGRFIWEMFPILQTMQFPWRLLGLAAPSIAIATGLMLSHRMSKHRLSTMIVCTILVTLALVNTRNYKSPIKTWSRAEFTERHELFVDKTTTSLRSEVVPKWAGDNERWNPVDPRLFLSRFGMHDGGAEITNAQEPSAGKLVFTAKAENDRAIAIYYKNYYPIWRGKIDGEPLSLSPSASGEILIPLREGEHQYTIYYQQTTVQVLGNIISLLSLLTLSILLLQSKLKLCQSK